MGAVRMLLQKLGLARRHASDNGLGAIKDKRRAQRLPITMPVAVYGYAGEEPFGENTESVNVSARGALVAISTEIACWQKILLTNLQTEEELECRVVRLLRTTTGQLLAGLEFPEAAPRFWRTGTSPLAEDFTFEG